MPVADEIERASGCRLRWVLAAADAIQKSLFEAYSGSAYDPDLIDGNAMDLELIDNANRGGANTIDELAAGAGDQPGQLDHPAPSTTTPATSTWNSSAPRHGCAFASTGCSTRS
jgi:hypothetical protein